MSNKCSDCNNRYEFNCKKMNYIKHSEDWSIKKNTNKKIDRYIIFIDEYGNKSKESTEFEYEVGETIRVNSTQVYRCMRKEIVSDELIHYFKQGIKRYDFDY